MARARGTPAASLSSSIVIARGSPATSGPLMDLFVVVGATTTLFGRRGRHHDIRRGEGDTMLDVGTGCGRDPTVVAYLTAHQT
jgi:hypothetical protein